MQNYFSKFPTSGGQINTHTMQFHYNFFVVLCVEKCSFDINGGHIFTLMCINGCHEYAALRGNYRGASYELVIPVVSALRVTNGALSTLTRQSIFL